MPTWSGICVTAVGIQFVVTTITRNAESTAIPSRHRWKVYMLYWKLLCADTSCVVLFEQLVDADPHRFQECIESSDGSEVPKYTY
jgi:hypothetical protein